MSDRLSADDLATVQRKLYAVKTEWYNLGLELGQRVSTLDGIDSKYSGDPSQCFRQVLKEWLKGVNPPPTWQAMVNALKSPTVAQYQLAEQIQTELPPALSMQPLSPHPLSPQPPSPQLLPPPPLSTSAQPHPKSLDGKHRSGPAHQTAPTMKHDTRPCIVPDSGQSSDEGVAVAQRNYQMIKGEFAKLLRNASSRLQLIVNIGEFRLYVVSLFQPGYCIPDSASVHEIFCAITRNMLWDCVNYFPLKQIIHEFASQDMQLSELVKQYEEARSGYMLCTKISDHIGVVAVSDSSDIDSDEQMEEKPAKYDAQYYHKLSLKVNAEVTEMSMQYVNWLWESLASHYHLPSLMAILDSVCDDCILVTWLIPTKHTLELIDKAHANSDFFQEHNVLWATVDDNDYLYNSKEEAANMPEQSKGYSQQRIASGNELQIFFLEISSQLSQPMEDVIAKLEEEEITAEDISYMSKQTLYQFGVETFEDAKIILEHAKQGKVVRARSSSSGNTKRFHQLTEIKLTEISTSLRDIFSESLDPSVGGLPCWEQFGERLLGLSARALQKFKNQNIPSPTAAIMHQKMGVDPTTTLADAVNILDEIGRKDVVEHIVRAVKSGGDQDITLPHHHNLSHKSSSLDSGYGSTRALTEHTLQCSSSLLPPVPVPVTVTPTMRDASSNSEAATCEPQNSTETLAAQLRSLTLEAKQQINVICDVYNTSTNMPIQGKAPTLRDITVTPRLQEFSAECVPLNTELQLQITTSAPCFLYIINIGASGKTTLLLPNEFQADNYFQEGQTYYLPGKDYGFRLEGPSGKEIIHVMAFSKKQVLALTSCTSANVEEPILRYISIIQRNAGSEMKCGFAQVEFLVR